MDNNKILFYETKLDWLMLKLKMVCIYAFKLKVFKLSFP